jgi:hypothetical protein
MSFRKSDVQVRETDRIDLEHEYELCVWARYFNASEKRVKEAVAAVGDRAIKVREHLRRATSSERPTSA